MGARNFNVLIGENQISYSIINGSGNDFMNNLNMIMDDKYLVNNYLLNNLFK